MTQCTGEKLENPALEQSPVTDRYYGARISSVAAGVLLRVVDKPIGLPTLESPPNHYRWSARCTATFGSRRQCSGVLARTIFGFATPTVPMTAKM